MREARNHLSRRCVLLFVVLMFTTARAGDDSTSSRRRPVDPEKFRPEKADPSCKSLGDRLSNFLGGDIESALAPCRFDDDHPEDEEIDNEQDPVYEDNPECVEVSSQQVPQQGGFGPWEGPQHEPPPPPESSAVSSSATSSTLCRPQNSILFNVYIAVPRNEFSIGHLVKLVVTFFLDATIPEYSYKLYQWQIDAYQNHDQIGKLFRMAVDLVRQIVQGRGDIAKYENYLVNADPKVVWKEQHLHWWRYRFRYHVFYSEDQRPVLDGPTLINIRRRSIQNLKSGVDLLQDTLIQHLGQDYPLLKVQMESPVKQEDEEAAATPENESFALPPPTDIPTIATPDHGDNGLNESPTTDSGDGDSDDDSAKKDREFAEPERVDTSEWDWQRYVGLGILLGTVTSTVCLMQLAACRRHLVSKKQLWGNLDTEEGVEELLRTGWKLQGSSMEVFDKKHVGYCEDSSIFMGGFEQRDSCCAVGAEITVTTPTTQAEPSSSHMSPGGAGTATMHDSNGSSSFSSERWVI